MSEIHVKEGESIDSALKRFKRSCAKAGVIAEVRKREHYESPLTYAIIGNNQEKVKDFFSNPKNLMVSRI